MHTTGGIGKESGGGVQTWDKDISSLIYKIWHRQSALSSSLINIPSQRSHTHAGAHTVNIQAVVLSLKLQFLSWPVDVGLGKK